jgi:hypothetical protein
MSKREVHLSIKIDMETGTTVVDGPFQDELAYLGLLGLGLLSLIETRAGAGKSAKRKEGGNIAIPSVLPPWAMPKKPS